MINRKIVFKNPVLTMNIITEIVKSIIRMENKFQRHFKAKHYT